MTAVFTKVEEIGSHEEYFALRREGCGQMNAAEAVGWTPAKLKKLLKDPEFLELDRIMQVRLLETIEEKEYELARRGNQRAIEMVLFCKAADRGWHPPTQKVSIERNDTVRIEMVNSTVAALKEALALPGAVAALQQGAIEATAHDD